ncbi:hypothetical protein BDA99DRAFT_527835 [Phascolomyces articulosus]|uniref:Uncharacterized protein n=1 Tax=Phascolomyces articulosus TaxID=60185 RepID=A0AAD5JM69_9FUNG|nr:hypothetical protein BDA99DRAFT_527835 [Phascolomyces articulosus]
MYLLIIIILTMPFSSFFFFNVLCIQKKTSYSTHFFSYMCFSFCPSIPYVKPPPSLPYLLLFFFFFTYPFVNILQYIPLSSLKIKIITFSII